MFVSGGVALAWLGCRLREKMNDIRVDLFQREQGEAFGGQGGLKQAAIFCYDFAGIPLHKTEIQNLLSIEEAGTAEARAEAMD